MGAGPVGLVLACELARRDVPIRLIDRLGRPTDESRAIVVHARSLEMLQRVGVVDRFLEAGVRSTAMTMHAADREIARVELDMVDSPYPFSVLLPQTETEAILTARLEELGGHVERGVALESFEQDDERVAARLGTGETVDASYVVGADGSHSAVRAQMGLKLDGAFSGETFVIADVEAESGHPSRLDAHLLRRGGFVPAVPMRGSRVRIITQRSPAPRNPRWRACRPWPTRARAASA